MVGNSQISDFRPSKSSPNLIDANLDDSVASSVKQSVLKFETVYFTLSGTKQKFPLNFNSDPVITLSRKCK